MATETEHKFLLNSLPQMGDFPATSRPTFANITQTYLTPPEPGITARVRHSWHRPVGGQSGRHDYRHTMKRLIGHGSNEEIETPILKARYEELLTQADPNSLPITKFRGVFKWGGLTWEFDEFDSGLAMLEVEVPELRDDLKLPPFLDVGAEVTGNALYANAVIARQSWRNGFRNRAAFLEALREGLGASLALYGMTLRVQEVSHNEMWLESSAGVLFRIRDGCESPDHDFLLSCMVVLGDSGDLVWVGHQGGKSMPELVDSITQEIHTHCSTRPWWPSTGSSSAP